MNGKRAKALKQLSDTCAIGYKPLKKMYNTLGRMSEHEEQQLNKAKADKDAIAASVSNALDNIINEVNDKNEI